MPAAPLSYRQVLRVPHLGRLLVATCLSRLAGRMFLLTLVLYALDRFHSPVFVGWLSAVAMAPGLLASPLSGAILDRIGAARAIALDMAASAALLLAIAAAAATGHDSPGLLLTLVGVFSLTSPLSGAGVRALLPRLVPTAVLDRANALDTLIHGVVDVTGPGLAGLLSAFVGAPVSLLLIAGLYAITAIQLRGLPVPSSAAVAAPLLRQAAEGLRTVARLPTLRGLVATYALYEICWGMLLVAVPVLLVRQVGVGEARDTLTGALWAGLGAAGMVGALLAGQWRTLHRERAVITLGTLVTAVGLYPVAGSGTLVGLAAGMAIMGAMAGPIDVSVLTLRQRRTPPDRLGRVLAVSMSLNQSGQPLGSAVGGCLLAWAPDTLLPTAALAAGLSALACWTLIPARDP